LIIGKKDNEKQKVTVQSKVSKRKQNETNVSVKSKVLKKGKKLSEDMLLMLVKSGHMLLKQKEEKSKKNKSANKKVPRHLITQEIDLMERNKQQENDELQRFSNTRTPHNRNHLSRFVDRNQSDR
jgi:hypothetical protein